jgi:hypothetical protein
MDQQVNGIATRSKADMLHVSCMQAITASHVPLVSLRQTAATLHHLLPRLANVLHDSAQEMVRRTHHAAHG